jgi:hypothetical protein
MGLLKAAGLLIGVCRKISCAEISGNQNSSTAVVLPGEHILMEARGRLGHAMMIKLMSHAIGTSVHVTFD